MTDGGNGKQVQINLDDPVQMAGIAQGAVMQSQEPLAAILSAVGDAPEMTPENMGRLFALLKMVFDSQTLILMELASLQRARMSRIAPVVNMPRIVEPWKRG
jgi:hypothetical protein